MNNSRTNQPKWRISRKFARRVTWLVVVMLILWGLYLQFADNILLPIANRQIHQMMGPDAVVDIGSLTFESRGVIRIRNLSVKPKQQDLYGSQLLQATEIEGRFSLLSLLFLRPRINQLSLDTFTVNVLYDSDNKLWNFDSLDFGKRNGGALPLVRARHGSVNVHVISEGKRRTVAVVGTEVSISPVRGHKQAYSINITADDRLAFGGSQLRGIWKTGDKGSMELRGNITMGKSPVFGNSWDIRDLLIDVEYDKKDMQINSFSFMAAEKSRLSLSGNVYNYRTSGNYDIRLVLTDWYLSGKTKPDSLVYDEGLKQKLGTALDRILTQYSPNGRCDIDVFCQGALDKSQKPELSGLIRCKDVSIMHDQFQYLMENMTGDIEVTHDSAKLNNLKCRHGKVDLLISGYSKGLGNDRTSEIVMTSENMLLDQDLYRALSTKNKQLWFTFAPSGLSKLTYRYKCIPPGQKSASLEIILLDAEAVYQHFPYPLKGLTGRVYIDKEKFELDNLASKYNGRTITLHGDVTGAGTDRPRFNIIIDANNVPIDDTLKQALTEKQRQFYESFQVDAITDVHIKVFPNEVGKRIVDYIAEVHIEDASVIYEKIPLPLEKVSVDANLTPDVVILKEMIGYNEEGCVQVTGKIWPLSEDRDKPGMCLEVNAWGLELREDWLKSLPQPAGTIVRDLRPTGKVDVDAILNIDAPEDNCSPNRAIVTCLGNELNFVYFPVPLQGLTGQITIVDNLVELEDIQVNRIVIDKELGKAMTGSAKSLFESTMPSGELAMSLDYGKYWTDENGDAWAQFNAELALLKCAFGKDDVFSGIEGTLQASGIYGIDKGLVEAEGDVYGKTFRLKDRLVENLSAHVVYDPNEGRFIANRMMGDCYKGRIMGDVVLQPPSPDGMEYSMALIFDGIEAADLLSEEMSGPKFIGSEGRGRVGGNVSVSGNLTALLASLGRIDISINDIELAKQSLLGKILSAIQFNQLKDYIFERVEVGAFLKGDSIIFERIEMIGTSLSLLGSGNLSLKDFSVNLDFAASAKKSKGDPTFFDEFIEAMGGAMLNITVRGNIEEPRIAVKALPGLVSPWRK